MTRQNVLTPTDTQAVRDVLHGGVGAAQRGRDRQVHERVGAERHHQRGPEEPVDGGVDRVPGVADDEVGDGDGQDEQHRPDSSSREPGPLGAPRRGHADDGREDHDQDRDHDRVAQQVPRALPEQDAVDLAPAGGAGVEGEQPEREQQRQGDERR